MRGPAETFSDVVEMMEDEGPAGPPDYGTARNLDIRAMYWQRDQTPFRVKLEGDDRMRRVLSVAKVDGTIVVEVES